MSDWPPLDVPYGSAPDGSRVSYAPAPAQPSPVSLALIMSRPPPPQPLQPPFYDPSLPRGDNPREVRKKAEKQRRDKLNHSISELAGMVPPVVAANRKIDKTGVLRLTAHFLRSHQYVFGDSLNTDQGFTAGSVRALLSLLRGFLLTTTYRGLVVVASPNIQEYLGYSELDLLGHSVFSIIHPEDQETMRRELMPRTLALGPNGELMGQEDEKEKVAKALASEKRSFIVRFKKHTLRSEPVQYVTCTVEGALRKSDGACSGYNRPWNMVRRARARSDNPCSSGNDVVFVGLVRPTAETFMSEKEIDGFKMEYRTRHSVDGEIIQCEQRIALVTGYMTHEVNGVNALNFMHRDDVRWVIIALRDMYDQHRVVGESCYRLITKNGQFVYVMTRGCLDVEGDSKVRSFVCTNTVVEECDGIHLIRMMKKKFMMMLNNNEEVPNEIDVREGNDLPPSVEDPKQLAKGILHLVTNLPSPQIEVSRGSSPEREPSPSLAIIPHRKERILSAIEKIYTVINQLSQPSKMENYSSQEASPEATNNGPAMNTEVSGGSGLAVRADAAAASARSANQNVGSATGSTPGSSSGSSGSGLSAPGTRSRLLAALVSPGPRPYRPSGLGSFERRRRSEYLLQSSESIPSRMALPAQRQGTALPAIPIGFLNYRDGYRIQGSNTAAAANVSSESTDSDETDDSMSVYRVATLLSSIGNEICLDSEDEEDFQQSTSAVGGTNDSNLFNVNSSRLSHFTQFTPLASQNRSSRVEPSTAMDVSYATAKKDSPVLSSSSSLDDGFWDTGRGDTYPVANEMSSSFSNVPKGYTSVAELNAHTAMPSLESTSLPLAGTSSSTIDEEEESFLQPRPPSTQSGLPLIQPSLPQCPDSIICVLGQSTSQPRCSYCQIGQSYIRLGYSSWPSRPSSHQLAYTVRQTRPSTFQLGNSPWPSRPQNYLPEYTIPPARPTPILLRGISCQAMSSYQVDSSCLARPSFLQLGHSSCQAGPSSHQPVSDNNNITPQTGTKRRCEELPTCAKQKKTDDSMAQIIEILDETIMNTDLNAIDTTLHSLDPGFPDMLKPNDIDEVLGDCSAEDEDPPAPSE